MRFVLSLLVVALVLPAAAPAAAGRPDVSFGERGVMASGEARAMTWVFPRGDGSVDAIADHDRFWRLDAGGRRTASPVWLGAWLVDAEPLADGFLGSWVTHASYRLDDPILQVVRYDRAGRPVTATNRRMGEGTWGAGIAPRPGGGAIALGSGNDPGGSSRAVLAATTAAGARDAAYRSSVLRPDAGESGLGGLVVDQAGRAYLLAGSRSDCAIGAPAHISVRRFAPDGTPDAAYGVRRVPLGRGRTVCGGGVFGDVLIDRAGRLVVVVIGGNATGSRVLRLLPDGRLDRSFSGDGLASASRTVTFTHMAEAPDGLLALAGRSPRGGRVAVVRLTRSGRVDPRFGVTYGRPSPSFRGALAEDIAVDTRGRVLVAGSVFRPGDRTSMEASRATVWRFRARP